MSKTTLVLVSVLALQLIVFGFASMDTHRVEKAEQFLSVDTSEIDYVHIENADGSLTMKRIGSQWKITDPYNYAANSKYTERLMEKMAELATETVITSSKSKHADYEVDDSTAAYVEIGVEGGAIDKFYCGKPSKTYTHTYMRKEGSDDVLLVAGNPRTPLRRRPSDWRDKSVLALDRTLIEKILLKHPREIVELTRNIEASVDTSMITGAVMDTTWLVTPDRGKPFAPDNRALNRIMNTLSRMNATDFLMPATDEMPDFSQPEFTAEVFLEGGGHVMVEFLPEPEDLSKKIDDVGDGAPSRWMVRKDGNDQVIFLVYPSSVKNLQKTSSDLMPEEDA